MKPSKAKPQIKEDYYPKKKIIIKKIYYFNNPSNSHLGFPGGSVVKNPPAIQETWVRSLGQEDPLEKEVATHSQFSCLGNSMDRGAWRASVHEVLK